MTSKRPTRQTCQANRASNRSRQPAVTMERPAGQRRPNDRTRATALREGVSRRDSTASAPQPASSAQPTSVNLPQCRL